MLRLTLSPPACVCVADRCASRSLRPTYSINRENTQLILVLLAPMADDVSHYNMEEPLLGWFATVRTKKELTTVSFSYSSSIIDIKPFPHILTSRHWRIGWRGRFHIVINISGILLPLGQTLKQSVWTAVDLDDKSFLFLLMCLSMWNLFIYIYFEVNPMLRLQQKSLKWSQLQSLHQLNWPE